MWWSMLEPSDLRVAVDRILAGFAFVVSATVYLMVVIVAGYVTHQPAASSIAIAALGVNSVLYGVQVFSFRVPLATMVLILLSWLLGLGAGIALLI